jgi:hypothetical protein
MVMQNKYIFNIIIANLLWSFIPVIVVDLYTEISIIMIIYLRFLASGIILLLLAILLSFINNKFTKNEKISISLLFRNLFRRNRRFYRIKNIYYYALLGAIGIILHVIFFYLTMKTTSIIFTMSGFLLSIIFIAFYEQELKSEKLDIFKAIYLILMIFTIGLLIYVAAVGANILGEDLPISGFIYLLIFSITISFLYISLDRDAYSKIEINSINLNKYYRIPRLLMKLSFSFILGLIFVFPILLVINLIPIDTDLTYETRVFFIQLPSILQILARWEILYLILFATIIPYLLVYIANVNWKTVSLTFSQWSSILNLIDPMGSLIFAVVLVSEYFPTELLFITIFILILSIILRYAHEVKNLVRATILLNLKKGAIKTLPLKILKYHGIISVEALAGTHDLLLNVKTNSIKEFYYLINERLRKLNEIKNLSILFINNVETFER